MTRRRIGLAAVALAASMALAACSTAASPAGSSDTATAPGADALSGQPEVDITFWHAMTGANGEALTKLVDEFNQQNAGKIKATLAFKNTYDDTVTAYKTALKGGQLPDVLQVYDIGTRFMIDSGSVLPVQAFVDKDGFDTSDIQPTIAGYYTVDKKLYSMPFNTSMPLMYINADAFTKAGLDPNKPPTTLDEIRAAAEKIKVAKNNSAAGETVQYGFGATLYGWFLEQFTANSAATLCDADNGRTGRASTVDLATDSNTKLLAWWQGMVRDGLALKLDSDTKNGDNAFTSGTVAMTLQSTGSLGSYVKSAGGKFGITTGAYPKISAGDAGGPVIGGASLWIVGQGKDAAHERASWELTKFLAAQPQQVAWHTSTGYFPISKGALSDPTDKQWVAQRPQFSTAITQLQNTPTNTATQGCSVGVMPQVRKDVEGAMQAAVLQGQDPKAALTTAQTKADAEIAAYNQALGG